jgi:hypothetical protein
VTSNVPGVAVYFYTLSQIRASLTNVAYFSIPGLPPVKLTTAAVPAGAPPPAAAGPGKTTSALPKLSREGVS